MTCHRDVRGCVCGHSLSWSLARSLTHLHRHFSWSLSAPPHFRPGLYDAESQSGDGGWPLQWLSGDDGDRGDE